ncbi:hypothetical protein ACOSP7_001990 [Xanthoceras sorbifolium]
MLCCSSTEQFLGGAVATCVFQSIILKLESAKVIKSGASQNIRKTSENDAAQRHKNLKTPIRLVSSRVPKFSWSVRLLAATLKSGQTSAKWVPLSSSSSSASSPLHHQLPPSCCVYYYYKLS